MVKFTSNEEMSNDAPYNDVSVTTSPILCMNNVLVLLHPATEFIIRLARVKTGCEVNHPYAKRLESLTICRCYYVGSVFSSVMQPF